jgi:phage shock protein PspC (stress-responsive transcriptional regulator)
MNKTELIHIAKQPFYIELPAYDILKQYLDDIKKHYDDQEIIDDIERSIAEKLADSLNSKDSVIEVTEIEAIIDQLGSVDDIASADTDQPASNKKTVSDDNSDNPKRLFRDTKRGELGGVAAGLAAYFGIDITWVRLAFVILTFFSGFGFAIYLILWVVVPEAKTLEDEYAMRGRNQTLIDIENTVKDKAKQLKDSSVIEDFVKFATQAIKVVIRAIGLTILLLSLFGISVAGVLAVGALARMDYISLPQAISSFPASNNDYLLIITSFIASLSLFALVTQLGLSLLYLKNKLNIYLSMGLVIVLIASGLIAVLTMAQIAPKLEKELGANKTSQSRDLEKFDSIVALDSVDVELVSGTEYSVEISGQSNQVANTKTDIKNGQLNISSDNKGYNFCFFVCSYTPHSVVVTLPQDADISEISLYGQSSLESQGFVSKEVYLYDQSRLEFYSDGDFGNIIATIADQSYMELECRSMQKFELTASDQSIADFEDCPAKVGRAYLSDQSSVSVNASKSIEVDKEDQVDFEQTGEAEVVEL